MVARFFVSVAIGSLLALGQTAAPAGKSVALTFDDLPAVGTQDAAAVRAITDDLLNALVRHHAPATGFVIGEHVEAVSGGRGQSILQLWTSRSFPLESHTYSHIDLTAVGAKEFEDDVVKNESVLAPFRASGGTTRYLRFPFNHTGDTAQKHDAIKAFLVAHGYRVATCTIDTSDYVFNAAYLVMQSRRDTASVKKLRAEYLDYSASEIDYYESLNAKVLGRAIPQVMLLHANRLNADLIEQLLTMFERRGYRFVTLDEAQSDEAYQVPDTFVSKFGPMWGYRWAKMRGVSVDGSKEPEPPQWIVDYAK